MFANCQIKSFRMILLPSSGSQQNGVLVGQIVKAVSGLAGRLGLEDGLVLSIHKEGCDLTDIVPMG